MKSYQESPSKRDALIAAILLALLLIFLLLLIISQQPPRVVDCPQSPRDAPQARIGRYVEGQVIVIGSAPAIDEVINAVPNAVEPTPLADCDLSYLGQLPAVPDRDSANLFPRDSLNALSVRLYAIKLTTTVTEAVDAINQQGAGRSDPVYADPNYLTISTVDAESCGSPNGDGGSPNGDGGSPVSDVGPEAAAQMFAQQWAFEHIGLDETLQSSLRAAGVDYEGSRIRVGVFDSSPFTVTQAEKFSIQQIDWTQPARPVLNLAVYPNNLPDIQRPAGVLTDVNDHGLFVAGLIHAVAPQTDIRLYQVLDKYGCGDLYTLVTELHEFISEVAAERGALDGAVINLSLGVLKPRATDVFTDELQLGQAQTESLNEQLEAAYAVLITDTVESLLLTTHIAYEQRIVVVAAVGNDSWRNEYRTRPRPPHYPAAYPFVIGVAGSNANRQRSCFSNWGEVAAPAGEGAPGMVRTVGGQIPSSCAASFKTPLISVVWDRVRFPNGYAKWNGTSFATPLVSGLAALTQEAGVRGNRWMHPSDVAQAIKCGAAAADGVINVPVTLVRCIQR